MKNTIKLIQEEIILKEGLFEDLTEGWKEEEHLSQSDVYVYKELLAEVRTPDSYTHLTLPTKRIV